MQCNSACSIPYSTISTSAVLPQGFNYNHVSKKTFQDTPTPVDYRISIHSIYFTHSE